MANNFISFDDSRRQILDYASRTDGQPVYIGKAHPDALTSESKWQIKKFTFNGSDQVTNIDFADGIANYVHIWDNRTSLDYTPDT